MPDRRVTVEDGKYTVVIPESATGEYAAPYMLRHGEPWPANQNPNNVELALAHRVIELEDAIRATALELQTWDGSDVRAIGDKLEKALSGG